MFDVAVAPLAPAAALPGAARAFRVSGNAVVDIRSMPPQSTYVVLVDGLLAGMPEGFSTIRAFNETGERTVRVSIAYCPFDNLEPGRYTELDAIELRVVVTPPGDPPTLAALSPDDHSNKYAVPPPPPFPGPDASREHWLCWLAYAEALPDTRCVPGLLALLRSDSDLGGAAIVQLGKLAVLDTVPELIQAVRDPRHQRAAHRPLERISGSPACLEWSSGTTWASHAYEVWSEWWAREEPSLRTRLGQ